MTPFEKIIAIRDLQGINSIQKIILLIIATHLGNNDFAFLSLTTLQEECCIKKRDSITNAITSLINLGYLSKKSPSDGYISNRYWIHYEAINQSPTVTSHRQSLVTVGDGGSHRGRLRESPWVTGVVTHGDPKRNIKEIKRNIKEERAQKARSSPSSFSGQYKNKKKGEPFDALEAIKRDYFEKYGDKK